MQQRTVGIVQWGVGAFLIISGALALVSTSAHPSLGVAATPVLANLDSLSITAGLVLLGVAAVAPPLAVVFAANLGAGAVLFLWAGEFVAGGDWAQVASYGLMGLATAVLPLFQAAPPLTTTGETVVAEEAGVERMRPTWLSMLLGDALHVLPVALFIFIFTNFVVQKFEVEGSSMEPSLHSGQYLWVNKAAYLSLDLERLAGVLPVEAKSLKTAAQSLNGPSRGDIVVFRYPQDPSRFFIKRVIGLPGDSIEVKPGHLLVNGQTVDEPYIEEPLLYSRPALVVPQGQLYVLGDNRNNSSDSHVWGLLPQENIIGKAWLSFWPLDTLGFAPNVSLALGAK